ncbi:MAG TPA: tripartite tricarboxylate transporter substrate binding protein [Candidatus Sulfotelmatobacter sp.]|nr:tripartite tricarboxylate transporter substrate binding protein [Candidatus Sulfotelmatobacter sp.]
MMLVVLTLLAGIATPAHAETWPTHAVRVIVPFPPGSTPDVVTRLLTPGLADAFHQPFVVDDRSGAGGNIGSDAVAKASPDGYTLLLGSNGPIAVNKALYANLPYDPERDLAPITLLVRAPQILAINPDVPARDFASFIAYAKAHPGTLSYGSVGSGSASHLTMEELKFHAGVDIVHVPYRGFPPAVTDLLAGQIQATVAIAAAVLPHIQAGKLRGLAITTAQRSTVAPDLPSVAELGFPELESYAWQGLHAPAGTPPTVIAALNAEIVRLLHQPAIHDALVHQGYEVIGDTPEAYAAFIKAETARWTAVVKRTGARVE